MPEKPTVPVPGVPKKIAVLTPAAERISDAMMYDDTSVRSRFHRAQSPVNLKLSIGGTKEMSSAGLVGKTTIFGAIAETADEVTPSPSVQLRHSSTGIDYLGEELLHRPTVPAEIGGEECCVEWQLGRVENGGESVQPGEGTGTDCIGPSTGGLERAPPETGTAGVRCRVPKPGASVGNGGEVICSSDLAPAWGASVGTTTSETPGVQGTRLKLGSHRALEQMDIGKEVRLLSATIEWPAPEDSERSRAFDSGEAEEPCRATEHVESAVCHICRSEEESLRVPALRGVEREPDGERGVRFGDYKFERGVLARRELHGDDHRGVRYRQPRDTTRETWSYSVGASDEREEKRWRRWRASGWMPYGTAEGTTSLESDASHSTPKGCAEDTGVLRGVMC